MIKKYKDKTSMSYLQMDALNTSFENEGFNVVLDKGEFNENF